MIASEKDVIDRVIDQMSDWSASPISDYSHKDLPWEVDISVRNAPVISVKLCQANI